MNQIDFKNTDNEWVQRSRINGKFTWTTSGVVWNGIKERCTEGSKRHTISPKYKGTLNDFVGFQEFANWHMKQVGYGLGYDLDADMLKNGAKRYSEDTCLLIPSALNRFIQSYRKSKDGLHQGISRSHKGLLMKCSFTHNDGKEVVVQKIFKEQDLQQAMQEYAKVKNQNADVWRERLNSNLYVVDQRVKDYMNSWVFKHKETDNE